MKKFIILGGGAIGSVFAGILAERYDTLLIGRKDHVERINSKGLTFTGRIEKNIRLKALTKIKKIEDESVIILTVKAHDTERAISEIIDKIKTDTVIVCIQNGLGTEDVVKKLVKCKVIRAVTLIGSTFLKEGEVRIATLSTTYIPEEEKEIAELLSTAGLPVEKKENMEEIIWEKLMINCVINGLGSVLRVENNKLKAKSLEKLKKSIIEECISVADKKGVKVLPGIYERTEKIIEESTNINSTLQDLMKRRRTEIDFLNGAIVKLAERYKTRTPVNEVIWNLVKTEEEIGLRQIHSQTET